MLRDKINFKRSPTAPAPEQNQKGRTPTMKRPPKMRTPDYTQLNLDQDKYYRPFIDGYFKILQTELKQVKHIGHLQLHDIYLRGTP